MRYVSTRGEAAELGFTEALLAGLATDGGLYVPAEWPSVPDREEGMDYAARAAQIMQRFVGDEITDDTFASMCRDAYSTFDHAAVVPLVRSLTSLRRGAVSTVPPSRSRMSRYSLSADVRALAQSAKSPGDLIVPRRATPFGGDRLHQNCAHAESYLYPTAPQRCAAQADTTVNSPNVHVVAIDGSSDCRIS